MKKRLHTPAILLILALLTLSLLTACGGGDSPAPEAVSETVSETMDADIAEQEAVTEAAAAQTPDPAQMSLAQLSAYKDDPELVTRWLEAHPFDLSYMELAAVESSAIAELGYAWPWEALAVHFTNSDHIYVYFGVAEETYRALYSADSIGAYYNQHVKGQYEMIKYD